MLDTLLQAAYGLNILIRVPVVGSLLLQVIYKSLYLGLFVAPQIRSQGWDAVPWGVSLSFIMMVGLWPGLIWAVWKPI
ncbi:MAG: hypothetical protein EBS42_03170 [Caulobacteraceae bacterium]|nr:hypothetical protein [Caulobacteraceae bacterium]